MIVMQSPVTCIGAGPTGAYVAPHLPDPQVTVEHALFTPGQDDARKHWTQLPAPSHAFPPLSVQPVPFGATVVPQTPLVHVGGAHVGEVVEHDAGDVQPTIPPLEEDAVTDEDAAALDADEDDELDAAEDATAVEEDDAAVPDAPPDPPEAPPEPVGVEGDPQPTSMKRTTRRWRMRSLSGERAW